MSKVSSVLILGTLPPPTGGVTISVKNLFVALKSKVKVNVFPTGLWTRYDIVHAHNYAPWKRFAMLVLGKILARKNVFTIHGMHFKENLWFNRLNLWLTDGVVIQNNNVLEFAPTLKKKPLLKIGSLVKEGIVTSANSQKILGLKTKPRVLIYAQHAGQYEGEDIYGVQFVLDLLGQIQQDFTIVLVDVANAYPNLKSHAQEQLVHLDKPLDFTQLLTEVDIYIRPTSKDGDSVAVLEAIMLGVPVLASNVTERRQEVLLYEYGNKESFLSALKQINLSELKTKNTNLPSVEDYLRFYQELLDN